VQYSYDDRSVVVVNDTPQDVKGLTVTATVLDFNLAQKFTREAAIAVSADAVARAFAIPAIPDLTTTYFVRLALHDSAGREVSRNFYWLSTEDDRLDWSKTQWYYTPTTHHANLTALGGLPRTEISLSPAFEGIGRESTVRIVVKNTGRALAFQVRLKLVGARGEILPVFWNDNYFELLPGEEREIQASYRRAEGEATPSIEAESWNTPETGVVIGRK